MKNIILSAKDITKHFPGILANDHINFDLYEGEIHSILGENGAGKSSILEAFLYNLYNISMRGNLDTLVHFNCGNMETDFIYINGDNTLRIVRGLKKAGQKYQSYLKVFLNNKDISMDTSGVTQEGIIKKFNKCFYKYVFKIPFI